MGGAALVVAVAALVTTAVVPLVVRVARRSGALRHRVGEGPGSDAPGAPVPTLGGLAMAAGVLAALVVARRVPAFAPSFASTSVPLAVVVGTAGIAVLGVLDDLRRLSPWSKLAGQLVVATAVALLGVQLVHFWLPGLGVLALSSDLGLPLTVLALVAMINAVNLVDGLDGLAAGIVAIAAVAFLLMTLPAPVAAAVGGSGSAGEAAATAGLVALIVAGVAVGFLVHNWYPARVFMGDTGSMLLGLLLGIAGVTYVGRTAAPSSADFTGAIPLFVPVLVLAVPFADTAFAVVRRMVTGRPIAHGDEGHLHHLLLAFGHSHRRAVLVLQYWSALVASIAVAPRLVGPVLGSVLVVAATIAGIVLTAVGARATRAADVAGPRG